MENLNSYLQILEDSLDKKLRILSDLHIMTEEQHQLLIQDTFSEDDFQEKVIRKGDLIEELVKLDDGFQMLYDKIKSLLEGHRDTYRERIAALQVKIRMIVDQGMALERKERTNEPLVTKRYVALRKEAGQVHRSRDLATSYYKSMNRISDEPSFMDTKK